MPRRQDDAAARSARGTRRRGTQDDPVALRERVQRQAAEIKALRDDNDRLQSDADRNARAARKRIDLAALGDLEADEVTEAKVQALQSLHQQKVRLLMQSVNTLRAQLDKLNAESKQHRRSAMINGLKDNLKQQELVSDVLKQALVDGAGMDAEAVNELVIKRTLGGPKRFRPKTREELENEVATLTRKHGKAVKALQAARSKSSSASGGAAGGARRASRTAAGGPGGAAAAAGGEPPSTATGMGGPSGGSGALPTADAAEISQMLQELETLRVQVQARERTIRNHQDEIRELHDQLRTASEFEDKFRSKDRKWRLEKERARKLQEANGELLRQRETEAAEREHAQAELELLREERARDGDAADSERLQQTQALQLLQQRELEMTRELEHHRRLASTEQRTASQTAKDAGRALVETQRRLETAEAERDRLAERNKRLDKRLSEAQDRLADQGSELSSRFDSINKESATAAERVRQAEARAEDRLRRAVDNERERHAADVQQLERQLAELRGEAKARADAFQALNQSKSATEQSLNALSENVSNQVSLVQDQTKQIMRMEHAMEDAVARAERAEHQLHVHQVELERASVLSVGERHEALAKANIELQSVVDERDRLQAQCSNQAQEMDTLRVAVSNLNKQVSAYRITLREKKEELRRLEAANRQMRAGYD